MDATKVARPNPNIIWRVVDDGAVLVSPQAGTVRVLNEVGTTIWKLLDGQRSLANITMALAEKFDAPEAQLASDLRVFLGDLMERGLIEMV